MTIRLAETLFPAVVSVLTLALVATLAGPQKSAYAQSCTPKDASGEVCIVPGEGRVVDFGSGEVREQAFVNRCAGDIVISYQWAGDFQSRKTIPGDANTLVRCNAAKCEAELTWGAICPDATAPGEMASLTVSGPATAPDAPADTPEEAENTSNEEPATDSASPDPVADPPPAEETVAEAAPEPAGEENDLAAEVARMPVTGGAAPADMGVEELDALILGSWESRGRVDRPCEVQSLNGTVDITDRLAPFYYVGRARIDGSVSVKDDCRLRPGLQETWTYVSDVAVEVRGDQIAITWHRVTEMNPGGTSIYRLRDGQLVSSGRTGNGVSQFDEILTKK